MDYGELISMLENLVSRLERVLESLENDGGSATWDE